MTLWALLGSKGPSGRCYLGTAVTLSRVRLPNLWSQWCDSCGTLTLSVLTLPLVPSALTLIISELLCDVLLFTGPCLNLMFLDWTDRMKLTKVGALTMEMHLGALSLKHTWCRLWLRARLGRTPSVVVQVCRLMTAAIPWML